MFSDARSLSPDTIIEADICIVGGGAAGITLAISLAQQNLKIVLLEAGGYDYEDEVQALYQGRSVGLQGWSLEDARLRMLGGSTNHWAGNCVPLDPIDFEQRQDIPYSGWPITFDDVLPYYQQACPILDLPTEQTFDTDFWKKKIGKSGFKLDEDRLRTYIYSESAPTNFGTKFRGDLKAAQNVNVLLYASALEAVANADASQVDTIRARSQDGNEFQVQAKKFVLAMGGVETARLLLLSKGSSPNGLGNHNDLVGRFFMDHVGLRPALTVMMRKRPDEADLYVKSQEVPGGRMRGAVLAADRLLREEGLPNFILHPFEAGASPGFRSARYTYRSIRKLQLPNEFGHHLGNVLSDLDGATNGILKDLTGSKSDFIPRQILDFWMEFAHFPNPDSRVYLDDELDAFGQRRVVLDWRLAERDSLAAQKTIEIVAREFRRQGHGPVWSPFFANNDDRIEWPEPTPHGKHHCGTTRMSSEPSEGVVDPNCQVHGISNLYVASSSVFPYIGAAQPTLTIVALALRLAEHLKRTS